MVPASAKVFYGTSVDALKFGSAGKTWTVGAKVMENGRCSEKKFFFTCRHGKVFIIPPYKTDAAARGWKGWATFLSYVQSSFGHPAAKKRGDIRKHELLIARANK